MEIALAFGFAVAAVLAFSAWMARGIEKARAQRLTDELAALRRPSPESGPQADTARGPSAEVSVVPPAAPEAVPYEKELRRALQAFGELQATLAAVNVPPAVRDLARSRAGDVEAWRAKLERLEAAVKDLLAQAEELAGSPAPEEQPEPPREMPLDAADALSLAERQVEELAADALRIGDALDVVASAAERASTAAGTSSSSLAVVERATEALGPFAGTLSGHADRVNLLALNVALLATRAGGEGAVFEEASSELRALFEDLRRHARELGSAAQRARDAARVAREALGDLRELAGEGRARTERDRLQLRRTDEVAARLRETLAAARQSVRVAEEQRGRLLPALDAAFAREAALRASRETEHQRLANMAAGLASALAGLVELRTAAEAALLRRESTPTPGPDPRLTACMELLTKIRLELDGRLNTEREGMPVNINR